MCVHIHQAGHYRVVFQIDYGLAIGWLRISLVNALDLAIGDIN